MSPRIVHCATTHRVGDPRIFWKECRTLADAGYEVVLIVPHDEDEVIEGVQIRAVPMPQSGKERLARTTGEVYRRALAEGKDAVIHLHDSDLLPAGLLLKARGRRVVYDAHEDTPKQMAYQHWIPRYLRSPAALGAAVLERLAAVLFDGIIAAEPENARRFPRRKTTLIRNFPIVHELSRDDAPPYASRVPRVLYLGSITAVRGLAQMVTAARTLHDEMGIELTLAGPFYPTALEEMVAGEPAVRITGPVDRRAAAALMAESRIGLVILHPERKYVESYPTKLFEYMAAGLPVVASDFPVWRAIVDEAGAGVTVDPLDQEAVTMAIRWLIEHPDEAETMGRRGREAVIEHYDWHREGERLVAFYRDLIGPPQP